MGDPSCSPDRLAGDGSAKDAPSLPPLPHRTNTPRNRTRADLADRDWLADYLLEYRKHARRDENVYIRLTPAQREWLDERRARTGETLVELLDRALRGLHGFSGYPEYQKTDPVIESYLRAPEGGKAWRKARRKLLCRRYQASSQRRLRGRRKQEKARARAAREEREVVQALERLLWGADGVVREVRDDGASVELVEVSADGGARAVGMRRSVEWVRTMAREGLARGSMAGDGADDERWRRFAEG